jgi:tRNA threonylcarbamoyladenosine biosynthesis protein TsaE
MDRGRALAETLSPGAVVALNGDLGAGKTHFVKGLAAGLGIPPETVRSPTFTILHEYTAGRLPLYHFDAYRIGDPSEFEAIGFAEYAYGDGITVVEWAARVEALLPPDTLHLRLTHVSAHERRIERVDG